MPIFKEFTFPSANGKTRIHVRSWEPDGAPIATVQIAHGIAEHAERYDGFMRFLAENGFRAAANDHLGHGQSVNSETELGFFADRDGWQIAIKDMHALHEILRSEASDAPCFLFGHSMGSFLARTYLIEYPDDLCGAVICGTGQQSSALVAAGRKAAGLICSLKGPTHKSPLLNNMAFGSYNNGFMPNRTPFDWLSRDEKIVDKYIADPLCGFLPTAGLFRDMMDGIKFISDPKNAAKMNKDLPVFFIAGEKDPVGENGAGVKKAYEMFIACGMKNASVKLYPDCRHELLNELNKQEVMNDILDWFKSVLK